MQRDIWSHGKRGRRFATLALVVLLVGGAAVAPAAAVPQMVFQNAGLSETTALVGEEVTVTATVENIGDTGGGYTLEFTRNGTQFASQRVSVPSETRLTFNQSVAFDSPGTYQIRVNGNTAGFLTVQRAVARVGETSASGRTLNVQARSVPTDDSYAVALPASNQSFRLDGWSVQTTESNYEQVLTAYTDPSASGVDLPSESQSSLVGLLTVDSNVTIENATMQFVINDSRLQDAGLEQEAVTVFQYDGSRWVPLETTVVEERTQSAVYEATGTAESEYAVGQIDASISAVDTVLRTEPTASGQQLIVEAELRNDGSVDGTYESSLSVNGGEVNATTTTVPAAGETTVTLTHEVTDAGTYQLSFGDTSVGSIVITEGQVTSGTDGDAETTESGTATDAAESTDTGSAPSDIGDVLPDSVPESVLGIDTLYVGSAVGIVVGILIGVLVMGRRGGGGPGGRNTGGFEL